MPQIVPPPREIPMKPEIKLARIFATLEDSGKKTDSVAAGILTIVAEAGVRDLDSFNPLVTTAYAENGWNPRPGRPTKGTEGLDMVPATVRTYVTAIRRAFRRGINVGAMKTFYDLRKALHDNKTARKRASLRDVPKAVQEHFEGVEIDATGDVNGALIHDVGVVYARLPKQHQNMFERQLQALVSKYLPLARVRITESEKKVA